MPSRSTTSSELKLLVLVSCIISQYHRFCSVLDSSVNKNTGIYTTSQNQCSTDSSFGAGPTSDVRI